MTGQEQKRKHLAHANRRIAECQEHIASQRMMIERLAQRGEETAWARGMLEALQASLRAFENHREWLVSEMDAESDHCSAG